MKCGENYLIARTTIVLLILQLIQVPGKYLLPVAVIMARITTMPPYVTTHQE